MKDQLDLSGLKKLRSRLKEASRGEIQWGYPEASDMHSDGMSQGKLAEWLNDGVRDGSGGWRIPPRPALMQSALTVKGAIEKDLRRDATKFFEGSTTVKQFKQDVGSYLVEDFQDTMRNWVSVGSEAPDNAASTIRKKGFNSPFTETGEHIQAATFILT